MSEQSPQDPTAEELPAWEQPEHQTPRIEEPDNKRNRLASILFILLPVLLVVVVGVGGCAMVQHFNDQFNKDNPGTQLIQR